MITTASGEAVQVSGRPAPPTRLVLPSLGVRASVVPIEMDQQGVDIQLVCATPILFGDELTSDSAWTAEQKLYWVDIDGPALHLLGRDESPVAGVEGVIAVIA